MKFFKQKIVYGAHSWPNPVRYGGYAGSCWFPLVNKDFRGYIYNFHTNNYTWFQALIGKSKKGQSRPIIE